VRFSLLQAVFLQYLLHPTRSAPFSAVCATLLPMIPHAPMPQVQEGSFLTLHYRMSGPQGQVIIDTFAGKPATLSLGMGELSPAIEQRLMGLEEGAHTVIELAEGEAFGDRQPEMVQWVARKLLNELGDPHEQYVAGDVVQFPTPDGLGTYAGAALQVRDDGAVLFDFNHPLAGQPVRFEVQLIGVL
jgi:FKBP-type peptidyl-prolyl cis-trans isomerase SlpA